MSQDPLESVESLRSHVTGRMAAVPGFSVTDLIQAVCHIKTVYDAFFNKYTNSAVQVRGLADRIQQFQTNLQAHKEIIEKRGLEYSGYVAIKNTLDECEDFLEKYKGVLEKKISVVKVWRTGRFPYEQDVVARLQKDIESHGLNILHFNMNILLYVISDYIACSYALSLTIWIEKMASPGKMQSLRTPFLKL